MTTPNAEFFAHYSSLSEEERDKQYPYCRVSIPGENLWGRQLDPNTAILCNSPIDSKYQFGDIVSLQNGKVDKILFRPYPVWLGFIYEFSLGDERKIRNGIFNAVKAQGYVSFFCAGRGNVLLEGEESIASTVAILSAMPGMMDVSRLIADGEDLKATTLWRKQ